MKWEWNWVTQWMHCLEIYICYCGSELHVYTLCIAFQKDQSGTPTHCYIHEWIRVAHVPNMIYGSLLHTCTILYVWIGVSRLPNIIYGSKWQPTHVWTSWVFDIFPLSNRKSGCTHNICIALIFYYLLDCCCIFVMNTHLSVVKFTWWLSNIVWELIIVFIVLLLDLDASSGLIEKNWYMKLSTS